jgi:SWI/SNF-related matrix-associated actin-dependent regulator of chromatin subfamily A3
MDRRTHFALKSLQNRKSLKYTGLIPRSELQQKLSAAAEPLGSTSTKLSCLMGILVFGPRWVADTLAKDLAKYRLFLQHPDYRPDDAPYYNPQYLGIPGSSFVNGAILPPISTEVLRTAKEQSVKLQHDDQPDLETVMDNLPRPSHLREAESDNKIRTTLLR